MKIHKPGYTYPSVLVFEEKHGDRFFHLTSEEDLRKAMNQICLERAKEGYWYSPEENKKIIDYLSEDHKTQNPKSCFSFMFHRKACEYEFWRIEPYEKVN